MNTSPYQKQRGEYFDLDMNGLIFYLWLVEPPKTHLVPVVATPLVL